MSRNKKYFVVIMYLVLLLIVILLVSGKIILMSTCEFYTQKIYFLVRLVVLLIFVPVLGVLFSWLVKIKKSNWFIYYAVVPIVVFAVCSGIKDKLKTQRTFSQTCIVRKAIIYKTFSGKNRQCVTVKFSDETYNYQWELRLIKYSANKLQEGDSLLIMYAKDCDVLREVYKPKPTITEFEKCTDYGYYYNGKLYSKGEFEAINQ
ncbi:MAG: hypothetical protein JKX79_04995 [Labilibaculum sp.]|nr:hypothetical protein [Labilibaculum sp.]